MKNLPTLWTDTIYLSGNGGLISSDNNGESWQKIGGINENN